MSLIGARPVPTNTAPTTDLSALMTDHYELTMIDSALQAGLHERKSTFEIFTRSLPKGRRYGVVAGMWRVIDAIANLRFNDEEIAWIDEQNIVSAETLELLRTFEFTGTVTGLHDGELYFANTPLLTVEAPFYQGLLLETLTLSILNHDCAIASAASLMSHAAPTKSLIDMGARRTDPHAAIAATCAAYISGVGVTSNLAAGKGFGIPTAGTTAHAWILAHETEIDAFTHQIASQGLGTTLLVDTYDIAQGIINAVEAAQRVGGTGPGAIRIDSGDPFIEVPAARKLLDKLGAVDTRIILSGDLDEQRIGELEAMELPVDAYGVGTQLVTGSGAPTATMVYKLVEFEHVVGTLTPVAKKSSGKATVGGMKRAARLLNQAGQALYEQRVHRNNEIEEYALRPALGGASSEGDLLGTLAPNTTTRDVSHTLVANGEQLYFRDLNQAQSHHEFVRRELLGPHAEPTPQA